MGAAKRREKVVLTQALQAMGVDPPGARMEAITSRALLLAGVGRAVRHAGQTTLHLTPLPAIQGRRGNMLMHISSFPPAARPGKLAGTTTMPSPIPAFIPAFIPAPVPAPKETSCPSPIWFVI